MGAAFRYGLVGPPGGPAAASCAPARLAATGVVSERLTKPRDRRRRGARWGNRAGACGYAGRRGQPTLQLPTDGDGLLGPPTVKPNDVDCPALRVRLWLTGVTVRMFPFRLEVPFQSEVTV